MSENLFATPFRFAVIGSNAKNIESIKNAFREITIPVLLTETYQSVKIFITSFLTLGAFDCIAIDYTAFAELEEHKKTIAAPLLVFANEGVAINAVHNVIFEVIHMPVEPKKLETALKKLGNTKAYFEKIVTETTVAKKQVNGNSKTFLVKKGKEFQLINSNTVAVFFTDNKITFAVDNKGTKFLIPLTLLELENQLDGTVFFRANRQSLINRKYIDRIKQLDEGRFEIIIDSVASLKIDINQQKFSRLKEWIENH